LGEMEEASLGQIKEKKGSLEITSSMPIHHLSKKKGKRRGCLRKAKRLKKKKKF